MGTGSLMKEGEEEEDDCRLEDEEDAEASRRLSKTESALVSGVEGT